MSPSACDPLGCPLWPRERAQSVFYSQQANCLLGVKVLYVCVVMVFAGLKGYNITTLTFPTSPNYVPCRQDGLAGCRRDSAGGDDSR